MCFFAFIKSYWISVCWKVQQFNLFCQILICTSNFFHLSLKIQKTFTFIRISLIVCISSLSLSHTHTHSLGCVEWEICAACFSVIWQPRKAILWKKRIREIAGSLSLSLSRSKISHQLVQEILPGLMWQKIAPFTTKSCFTYQCENVVVVEKTVKITTYRVAWTHMWVHGP